MTIFIDAVETKKVAVYKGAGNCIGAASTAKMLKYILETHKIDVFKETIYYGSTMDFADEVGFATHDGAKKIVDAAVDMIKCEMVAEELA